MNFDSHFQNLHHAYLIEGNYSLIKPKLIDILVNSHNVSFKSNADVLMVIFNTFTIDDARELKNNAIKKKTTDGKRIFIVSANSMTREASNALLKTLEEPGEDTHFFFILPSLSNVLPTILSRVQVVKGIEDDHQHLYESFVSKLPAERMKWIKETMSDIEKEKIPKGEVQNYAVKIMRGYYENDFKTASSNKNKLSNLSFVSTYLRDQSASLKMILEYLALNI